MKYEVFTERFEVEKMAEDIFICDDKPLIYIDYADLRTLRRISTLKYGISIKAHFSGDELINEILKVIETHSIPVSELKTYLIHIRINEADLSFTCENMGNLIQQIRNLKGEVDSDESFEGLYAVTNSSSIPIGEWHINLVLGIGKTAEDKFEDDKHEQMIEEYHKSKLSPVKCDFSELFINLNNEN